MSSHRAWKTLIFVLLSIGWAAQALAGVYFIHADHLGTPRVVSDQAGTVVWKADYDAFGKATLTTNVYALNLRFPGQYFDAETNLHYNYFRDYDPTVGRYLQSDPLGLEGGINTYVYGGNNPIRYTDPEGLFFGDPASFTVTVEASVGVGVSAAALAAAAIGSAFYPSPAGEGSYLNPGERPWRNGGRWLVYVRCNVNKQENCIGCPDTIGGKAFGGTFTNAFASAQTDANLNLGASGARNCQARHCQPVACFESGRKVPCPKSGR